MSVEETETQIWLHTFVHANVGAGSSGKYVRLDNREQMYNKQSYITDEEILICAYVR
jgi:hypothetical protein